LAISIPFSLLAGKEDEVIVSFLFTGLRTLGRGGVTSGAHGHMYLPSLGKRGKDVMITSILPPWGREEVRSWSPRPSLIWKGGGWPGHVLLHIHSFGNSGKVLCGVME
jgi:hypothetical protein